MEISPFKLTELLIYSFLYGGMLGVINDINRIIRVFFGVRYSRKRFNGLYNFLKINKSESDVNENKISNICLNIIIVMQDIFLMLSFAVGVIILNYYYNDGKIRFFGLFTTLIGFFLYYFTLGKVIMLISEPIMLVCRTVFKQVFIVVSAPVKFLFKIVGRFVSKTNLLIKKHIAKRRNIRYNKKEGKRLAFLSKCGFLDVLIQKEFYNEG